MAEENTEIKLKEQHRNTRHDAAELATALFAEWAAKGYVFPTSLEHGIIGGIMNLKQRKP